LKRTAVKLMQRTLMAEERASISFFHETGCPPRLAARRAAVMAAGAKSGASCRFQFQKRGQPFISVHNVTLPVAMRVNNPDRSPVHVYS
jgi:hypothetical protein